MTTSEVPATPAEAVRELRTIAHGWVDGQHGDPAFLIDAALRALTAGVDTPSLLHLAALMSAEHDEAPALFRRVMDELGFGFHPSGDYWEDRLALARWWACEIVDGWLDPVDGAALVIENVAEPYGRCEELNPFIHLMIDRWEPGGPRLSPEEFAARLTKAAAEVVARIPPPVRPG